MLIMAMDIHVYDTYVKNKNGDTMHFDVITDVKDLEKALEYAKPVSYTHLTLPTILLV